MDNTLMAERAALRARLFSRYSEGKLNKFDQWLESKHGRKVYQLFAGFARQYRDAGHEKCGASLLGNRIRWEMSVEEYNDRKVPNNFLPMLARQLACDDGSFAGFFNFHGVGEVCATA